MKDRYKSEQALQLVSEALDEVSKGFYNNRAYVQTLQQIYSEDIKGLRRLLA